MRADRIVLGFVLTAAMGLSACGTMTKGGSQTVDVVVKGSPSAFCEFATSTARNTGTFPNKVTLERSREPLMVECRGEQNLYKKFQIKPMVTAEGTVGNIPFGIIPGIGYDLASGGAWEYPNPLIVDFRVVGEGPKPAWPENKADAPAVDETRVGTADIEKPSPVRMQPILESDLNPALASRDKPKPVVVDAVSLASEKPATSAPTQIANKGSMKPVVSPEDDPAILKAKQEAKAKAKAEADKKAKAKAAAKKKAAAEAKAKAEAEKKAEAAKPAETAKPETLPEATATAPADANMATPATPSDTVKPATDASPAPTAADVKKADAPAATPVIENAAPATVSVPKKDDGAQKIDADKYLTGDGQ